MDLNHTSTDPKTLIMNQIRQEAAVNNARQLIDVLFSHSPILLFSLPDHPTNPPTSESQRPLFQQMYTFTQHITVKKGGKLFIGMHGEIYGHMEYGQQGVYCADTEDGGASWRRRV